MNLNTSSGLLIVSSPTDALRGVPWGFSRKTIWAFDGSVPNAFGSWGAVEEPSAGQSAVIGFSRQESDSFEVAVRADGIFDYSILESDNVGYGSNCDDSELRGLLSQSPDTQTSVHQSSNPSPVFTTPSASPTHDPSSSLNVEDLFQKQRQWKNTVVRYFNCLSNDLGLDLTCDESGQLSNACSLESVLGADVFQTYSIYIREGNIEGSKKPDRRLDLIKGALDRYLQTEKQMRERKCEIDAFIVESRSNIGLDPSFLNPNPENSGFVNGDNDIQDLWRLYCAYIESGSLSVNSRFQSLVEKSIQDVSTSLVVDSLALKTVPEPSAEPSAEPAPVVLEPVLELVQVPAPVLDPVVGAVEEKSAVKRLKKEQKKKNAAFRRSLASGNIDDQVFPEDPGEFFSQMKRLYSTFEPLKEGEGIVELKVRAFEFYKSLNSDSAQSNSGLVGRVTETAVQRPKGLSSKQLRKIKREKMQALKRVVRLLNKQCVSSQVDYIGYDVIDCFWEGDVPSLTVNKAQLRAYLINKGVDSRNIHKSQLETIERNIKKYLFSLDLVFKDHWSSFCQMDQPLNEDFEIFCKFDESYRAARRDFDRVLDHVCSDEGWGYELFFTREEGFAVELNDMGSVDSIEIEVEIVPPPSSDSDSDL